MSDTVFLNISTNKVDSTCSIDLGVPIDEWHSMSESEQDEVIACFKFNIMDMWITEGNSGE